MGFIPVHKPNILLGHDNNNNNTYNNTNLQFETDIQYNSGLIDRTQTEQGTDKTMGQNVLRRRTRATKQMQIPRSIERKGLRPVQQMPIHLTRKGSRPAQHMPIHLVPRLIGRKGPQRRALVFGLDYEGKDYELYGCINDAHNMHALLRDVYKFNEILLMTDHTAALPTRNNMLKAFRWLVSDVQPNDSLALHYSGHGDLQHSPQSYLKRTGYDDTIVPLDWEQTGQILDDDLFKYLVLPLQGKGCLTATFDCCHSGTGLDLKKNYQIINDQVTKMPDDDRSPVQSNVVLYSACLDEQTADDINDETGSYGTLTHSLLQILNLYNYSITHRTLLRQLQRVIKQTSAQRPQLSSERELRLDTPFSFICATNSRV